MKIKQVCEKTGLTERTVRFYIARGLIEPDAREMNNRTYREFDDGDMKRLGRVAALRKAGFSIEAILEMTRRPDRIAARIDERVRVLEDEQAQQARVLETLGAMRGRPFQSVDALADGLIQPTAPIRLPRCDVRPVFYLFDKITKEERRKALDDFEKSQMRQYRRGRMIVFAIAILNIAGAIASSVIRFDFISLIIEIALSAALFMGVAWVRYLFAAGAGLSVALSARLLIEAGSSLRAEHPGLLIFFIVWVVYSLMSCILLFRSRSVSEFLYAQRNG